MPEVAPIPLSQLTTLRTGGEPARLIEARTADELVAALREVWADGDEWFVLGGGSNLFVGDEPFDGTVIRVRTAGIEELPGSRPETVRLRVQAGHDWDALVAETVERGLAGIEAMSGIPGTVGAAPVQNVGAYGQEIVQTLVEVELIDESTGDVSVVPAAELGLGFRTSVLKQHYGSIPDRSAVILSVTLELERVGAGERPITGDQLRGALGLDADDAVSLRWIRDHVLATRARKGMVLDAEDPDTWSAGSFFQNAIVSEAFARTLPEACPKWPMAPVLDPVTVIPLAAFDGILPPPPVERHEVKVSAAWLIENAGLRRGFRFPRSRAGLSTKHTLALTNRGEATAAEISELARFVQSRVHSEFGLILQPEPVLVNVEL
ncbi:UDP-N-acetylmuramate dehydrogenase [Microbacterium testaceum]|uniref:UDP-N-acetylmuramate dehydrogenase n=1 Tax=Microbacterium testaceum TaxID=2033 RepID=UPI000734D660|nr:UDP-N-acetylmuramate dehydrogenase [Microbacterium testaceum]KTS02364.1 UDP-N-acetylenolpyruvoylglucosamine reductase [Microbacterium testaceum]KTS64478.1 UDP-N-acetylenolpyruvoylglucosamine reductase [Microbacterium testaceum]KTS89080.1 UDP-N-acetylenolpyruvoylglucosamine reductase [Microbacterium testaceum]